MKKWRFMSMILSLFLLFNSVMTTHASGYTIDLNETKNQMQEVLDEENIDASVSILSSDEAVSFLRYIRNSYTIQSLDLQLKNDGYSLVESKIAAFEILDNFSDKGAIFAFETYTNTNNDSLLIIYMYDEQKDQLELIHGSVITATLQQVSYYTSYFQPVSYNRYTLQDFNDRSFLCSLSAAVACTAFSAMLFAFIPASIAVGLTCDAAFAYVCGYA